MSHRRQSVFLSRFASAMLLATIAISAPAQEEVDEAPGPVMDRIELDAAEITGNRELPKVMVIVPWKNPDPDDLPGPPLSTLLDEAPAPLAREEFTRQVKYFNEFYGKQK